MKDLLGYLLYRGMAFLVPFLPRRTMVRTGRVLGALYARLSPRARRTGIENLRRVFPDRKDHARLLRAALAQAGVSLLDALWSRRLTPEAARRYVEADPARVAWFKDHVQAGRGVVVATAHFGSWEMLNLAAPGLGFPRATFIARPVRNRLVDRHLRRERERTGNALVYRENALRACLTALRRGEVACSVIDVYLRPQQGGLYVDFFGTPALTSGALATLALLRHAPLIFIVCRPLDGGMRYVLEAEEIPVNADAPDRPAEVLRVTQELSHALERRVRAHPENWIWDYKRWHWRPGEWPDGYPSYSSWVTRHL